MKNFKFIIALLIALVITYIVATTYAEKVERINNGDLVQVSESYRDR